MEFTISPAVPTVAQIARIFMHTEMAAAIRGSEIAIIEECGHLSPMERPHAVTALMRQWLIR